MPADSEETLIEWLLSAVETPLSRNNRGSNCNFGVQLKVESCRPDVAKVLPHISILIERKRSGRYVQRAGRNIYAIKYIAVYYLRR